MSSNYEAGIGMQEDGDRIRIVGGIRCSAKDVLASLHHNAEGTASRGSRDFSERESVFKTIHLTQVHDRGGAA